MYAPYSLNITINNKQSAQLTDIKSNNDFITIYQIKIQTQQLKCGECKLRWTIAVKPRPQQQQRRNNIVECYKSNEGPRDALY